MPSHVSTAEIFGYGVQGESAPTPEQANALAEYAAAHRARKAAEERRELVADAFGYAADHALDAAMAEVEALKNLKRLLPHD